VIEGDPMQSDSEIHLLTARMLDLTTEVVYKLIIQLWEHKSKNLPITGRGSDLFSLPSDVDVNCFHIWP